MYFGEEALSGTSSAQYLLDHIFIYRRDQNLLISHVRNAD